MGEVGLGPSELARRPRRSAPRLTALLTLLLLVPTSLGGCRSLGRLSDDAYTWGATTFAPNPAANPPWLAGLALGFGVGLPSCLVSWPLTLLLYPNDEDAYFLEAALAPAILSGVVVGTTLAGPFYPFGLPFVPSEP